MGVVVGVVMGVVVGVVVGVVLGGVVGDDGVVSGAGRDVTASPFMASLSVDGGGKPACIAADAAANPNPAGPAVTPDMPTTAPAMRAAVLAPTSAVVGMSWVWRDGERGACGA
jgi:hypothetical protein